MPKKRKNRPKKHKPRVRIFVSSDKKSSRRSLHAEYLEAPKIYSSAEAGKTYFSPYSRNSSSNSMPPALTRPR